MCLLLLCSKSDEEVLRFSVLFFVLCFGVFVCFSENGNRIVRLFCRLVYDHPNEKTAEWITSFSQKKNSLFEMFASVDLMTTEIGFSF